MGIVVEREDIMRFSQVEFPDGITIVGEAVEYTVSCGCRVVYGIRHDKVEKCVLVFPCEEHPKLKDNVLAMGQPGHHMYEAPTDEAIAWAVLYS